MFLPFYDGLSAADQFAYLDRWPPPQAWITQFLDPEIDADMARIDLEDGFGWTPPVNWRSRLTGD